MFRQDRANPGTRVSQWRGRHDTAKGWSGSRVSTWLNGGLFAGGIVDGAYWVGGLNSLRAVIKTLFASDSTSTLAATLGSNTYGFAGCGDGMVAGYSAGNDVGVSPWGTNVMDKQTFADESNVTLGSVLPQLRWLLAAAGNAGNDGYFAGGQYQNGAATLMDTLFKVDFSDDSMSTSAETLTQGIMGMGSLANNGVAAYWTGGTTGAEVDTIDKTDFSDDSTANIVDTLSDSVVYVTGFANSGTAGYTGSGHDGSVGLDFVDKITFSDDGVAALAATITTRWSVASAGQKGEHGYFAGGYQSPDSPTGYVDTMEKLDFSDDSIGAAGSTLPAASGAKADFACDSGL